MIRQGDILLKEVKIEEYKNKKLVGKGEKVLAYGEKTGHSHVMKGDVEFYDNGDGTVICSVNSKAELIHQEHKKIDVEKGDYLVVRQREFDLVEGIRQVRD